MSARESVGKRGGGERGEQTVGGGRPGFKGAPVRRPIAQTMAYRQIAGPGVVLYACPFSPLLAVRVL